MDIKTEIKNPIIKPMPPPGLAKLIELCQLIYPDQPNPLQVTTVLKYWLGGQDPLDYISMYSHPGDPESNIPPHWHYITFGLSDLHGDGRVHTPEISDNIEQRSGMGFELTFRLLKDKSERESAPGTVQRPPTWPANLLQALAMYVFQTGNRLCTGDNIPWRSLDHTKSNIQLCNMLIADDPQMPRMKTPFGWVDFCQVVGVTPEELDQASRWNGKGILNLLRKDLSTGGNWLVTDIARSKSVFELFPETLRQLEIDLEIEGSDLAGVNADFTFKEIPRMNIKTEIDTIAFNDKCQVEDSDHLDKIDQENKIINIKTETDIKQEKLEEEIDNSSTTATASLMMSCPVFDSLPVPSRMTYLEGLQLTLAPYTAKFLVLAIRDRIRHGRHFTLKSNNLALTFVAESVTGAVVSKDNPFGVMGYWVQVLISDDLIPRMLETIKELETKPDTILIPTVYEWADKNLKIVIDHPGQEFGLL